MRRSAMVISSSLGFLQRRHLVVVHLPYALNMLTNPTGFQQSFSFLLEVSKASLNPGSWV